ncbi:MAG: hypothetical protein GY787_23870 [Alteromonadales bacterium]|nr:hypothetical protein [Alteromonadales bacterium]
MKSIKNGYKKNHQLKGILEKLKNAVNIYKTNARLVINNTIGVNRMIKPKVKFINGVYQCCRWLGNEWVGFGATQLEAYESWYVKNEAPDTFHLAA